MKCLNEMCPLNKDKMCDNDVFIEGRGSCESKYKVQPKVDIQYGNTKILFPDRGIAL